jgi:hypothetical protein
MLVFVKVNGVGICMKKMAGGLDTNVYTGCPTHYRTRHLFNNSNTNEDIAMKFELEYVRCVRNEEECVCSACLFRCNIYIGVRIIKEMSVSVASGTPCTFKSMLFVVYIMKM